MRVEHQNDIMTGHTKQVAAEVCMQRQAELPIDFQDRSQSPTFPFVHSDLVDAQVRFIVGWMHLVFSFQYCTLCRG